MCMPDGNPSREMLREILDGPTEVADEFRAAIENKEDMDL